MNARVAVLGTGKMGSAIARRLAEAGNQVTLWNRSRERAEQVGVGRVAASAADAVAEAEQVRPLLELFGEVRHVGPLGSGARVKLVANSMLGAVSVAAAELQAAGEAAGLDPEAVFGVLVRQVPALELRREGYVHSRHEPALFALRDLRKDLGLALDMFHAAEMPIPLTALVRELVDEAAPQGNDLDITAVMQRYRQPHHPTA